MNKVNFIEGNAKEILKTLDDCSVDSVVTDPPSGTNLIIPFSESSDDSRYLDFDNPLGRLRANFKTTHSVNMKLRESFKDNVWPVLEECSRVMKPGSYGIFWAFPRSSHWLSWGLEEAGLSIIDVIIRTLKRRRPKSPLVKGVRSTQLVQEVEHWVLVRKPGKQTATKNYNEYGTGYMNVVENTKRLSNLWTDFPLPAKETDHPTEKPVNLMRKMIHLVTPEEGKILDPFMGTGATGIASYLEDREFVGIEMNSRYVNTCKRRMNLLIQKLEGSRDDTFKCSGQSEDELPDEIKLGDFFSSNQD